MARADAEKLLRIHSLRSDVERSKLPLAKRGAAPLEGMAIYLWFAAVGVRKLLFPDDKQRGGAVRVALSDSTIARASDKKLVDMVTACSAIALARP